MRHTMNFPNMANAYTSAGTAPATAVYIPLVPEHIDGPIPSPAPPCTDLAFDEQCIKADFEKQLYYSAKESKMRAAEENSASDKKGLLSGFKTFASHMVLNVEKGASEVAARARDQARNLERQYHTDMFKSLFPAYSERGENLLAAYACAVMHEGSKISGTMYITSHNVFFYASMGSAMNEMREAIINATSSSSAASDNRVQGIKEVIPLSEIASIQPGVSLETFDKNAPYFVPLPHPQVRIYAMEMYRPSTQSLYKFFSFESARNKAGDIFCGNVKMTCAEKAYSYIDRAWRSTVEVPLPGVKYV